MKDSEQFVLLKKVQDDLVLSLTFKGMYPRQRFSWVCEMIAKFFFDFAVKTEGDHTTIHHVEFEKADQDLSWLIDLGWLALGDAIMGGRKIGKEASSKSLLRKISHHKSSWSRKMSELIGGMEEVRVVHPSHTPNSSFTSCLTPFPMTRRKLLGMIALEWVGTESESDADEAIAFIWKGVGDYSNSHSEVILEALPKLPRHRVVGLMKRAEEVFIKIPPESLFGRAIVSVSESIFYRCVMTLVDNLSDQGHRQKMIEIGAIASS